jgi:phosphoglycolate phosphatase
MTLKLPLKLPLKLIVFDLDGTLVDSQHVIVATMRAAFAAYDLPAPSAESVRRIVGLPLVDGVARLAPDLDPPRHTALAQAYRDGYQPTLARSAGTDHLFPGVRAMLDDLCAAGFRLGIATGKSQRGLRATLERHDLLDRFTTLQTGDVPPGKPHPAMLLRAIEDAAVRPSETAMIGDTTYDIDMARAAGALPIGVAWGYHPVPELKGAGAVHLVSGCGEIPPLLAPLAGSCPPVAPANGPSR